MLTIVQLEGRCDPVTLFTLALSVPSFLFPDFAPGKLYFHLFFSFQVTDYGLLPKSVVTIIATV